MAFQDNAKTEFASDLEEASALQKGEAQCVDSFVRSNISWMLRAATRIVKDRALAEDCVQSAFVQIFQSLDGFRGEASLRSWMRRIVINQALGVLRKRERMRESPFADLSPSFDAGGCRIQQAWQATDTPETLLASSQVTTAVLAAIDSLPDIYRVVILLRDIEEFSTTEVSEMLEIGESNVKIRLHRARAALKILLEPIYGGRGQI